MRFKNFRLPKFVDILRNIAGQMFKKIFRKGLKLKKTLVFLAVFFTKLYPSLFQDWMFYFYLWPFDQPIIVDCIKGLVVFWYWRNSLILQKHFVTFWGLNKQVFCEFPWGLCQFHGFLLGLVTGLSCWRLPVIFCLKNY